MENTELVALGAQAEKEIAPVASQASAIAAAIKDQGTYEGAARYLQTIKAARKRVAEILDPFVQAAHGAWKKAVAERSKYDSPLDEAENIVKPAMSKWWSAEQDRIESERRRLEAEAKKREEDRMLAEAEAAAAAGDHASAESILEQPVNVSPPVIPATPKVSGISMREEWKCEVSNLVELVKAVAAGKVPMGAIQANIVFLGQQARSLKGEMKYAGVRVWSQKNVAARV
jgi:hypothetical protein